MSCLLQMSDNLSFLGPSKKLMVAGLERHCHYVAAGNRTLRIQLLLKGNNSSFELNMKNCGSWNEGSGYPQVTCFSVEVVT